MRIPLKLKFVLAFIPVVIIPGVIATAVGLHFISTNVVREVQERVRTDLNAAREIYDQRLRDIERALTLTAMRTFAVQHALLANDRELLLSALQTALREENLDILAITDERGRVVARAQNPDVYGDSQSEDALVRRVLQHRRAFSATQIVSRLELEKEGEELAEKAHITFIETPRARVRAETEETAGMMLKSAVPVLSDEGVLIGVVYGGSLLNRNFEIVDRVKDVVYQGVTYEDQDMGAATIFQGDLRISTNVRNADGSRAIGTRVSEEVYDTVLKRGETWIERAFVVNNWYITAYEPLRDVDEAVIGMLYVGMLEQKYADMKQRTMWAFVSITFLGMALGAIVSYLLANGILKPIRALVAASKRLAEGDFSHRVGQISEDEIGELGQTFNIMASSLKERDEKLKEHAERRIMESERLATIGQLAAGVAHEINNPLGGILVYSHLLLEDTAEDDPKRANLEKIAGEATRCKDIIKGLLDFAHQTEPKIEPADLNRLVESALGLLEDQALFQNINVGRRLAPSLPEIMADGNQLVQVFINIMLNAAEAMEGRGDLLLATRLGGDGRYVEVEITDTGPGIPEDVVEKLFEPFYTTKEVGSGTGLGLSISYGVIERHGGTIQVRSQVGEGATFIIRLPIEEPAMRPEEI
ncbi:hypothetical protein AMJ82_04000 [candidate division TA06 bacterium SM23_40]|uniref:histidine kinase n=1 Tax=candidate division TA06 bacterium SM23_40 TaxID=1703774 RepID=A0A0S8GAB6_UNCT6|nr:MAG: hypothetical protein AMJ82_04000 [candidate division TA06 bacterium SM23_40]